MSGISLIFGTSNSVPVGTPDCRIEEIYQKAYKPFLQTIYQYPEIRLTLHYSGWLLEWYEEKHPEIIMLLNDMVKKHQVEILGGTYYDALLPLIPTNDRSGQIELLTTLVRRKFGKRPRGVWVADCAWEPSMPSGLNRSGMEYLFLEAEQFEAAGLHGSDLSFPCITEDQGRTIIVYPLTPDFSLLHFDRSPSDIIQDALDWSSENPGAIISLIVPGESFGYWGNSHKVLFEEGWLSTMLDDLLSLKQEISTRHPDASLWSGHPLPKVYFPCSSYRHINNSDLTTSKADSSTRHVGGFRQLLTAFPEANFMYAKMIHTHILVNQVKGDKYRKRAAREQLWKGECNTAYWHGKRDGIYRNLTRKAVYSALISAEKSSRQRGIFKSHLSAEDFDMDGEEEYLYHGTDVNIYLHRRGAIAFELDYLPRPWNYLDTFAGMPAEQSAYKPYPRRAFLDHFFLPNETLENFRTMSHREMGDFLNKVYQVGELRKDAMSILFCAQGSVADGETFLPVEIKKRFTMRRNTVTLAYTITNNAEKPLHTVFGSEINLSFHSMDKKALKIDFQKKGNVSAAKTEFGNLTQISGFSSIDLKSGVSISASFSDECSVWMMPVDTTWVSMNGHASEYQFTCFLPRWILNLAPKQSKQIIIQVSLSRAK